MGKYQADENSQTPELPECLEPDIILEHLSWHASKSTMCTIKKRYGAYTNEVERLLVVNTQEEDFLREQAGVPGFYGNAEIYQPDYLYIDSDATKQENQKFKYDAIYNARLDDFKRHSLCSAVDNIRFLTGGKGALIGQINDLENSSVSYEMLSAREVGAEVHQSRCGLALSAQEGTMRSSTEYLLCGRPVVSTRSVGGRDIYYTNENCRIVDATPEAVREAVQYWIENPPDQKLIRRKVLAQLNSYRYAYSRKISQLQSSRGGTSERPERIFYDLFVNRHVFLRRSHGADGDSTKNELKRLLAYPKTEILFLKSNLFREQEGDSGFILKGMQLQIQLDELSSWILSQLDGQTTVTSIIEKLVSAYGSRQRIEEELRDTLTRFINLGVVLIVNQVQ